MDGKLLNTGGAQKVWKTCYLSRIFTSMEIAAAALLNRTLFKNCCMHVIYYCVEILLGNLKLFPFFSDGHQVQ